jgi:hypothetical protein
LRDGTLAQYISGITEWINLKFGGFIEYLSKFACAKNCGDTLQGTAVTMIRTKISRNWIQKQTLKKKYFSILIILILFPGTV